MALETEGGTESQTEQEVDPNARSDEGFTSFEEPEKEEEASEEEEKSEAEDSETEEGEGSGEGSEEDKTSSEKPAKREPWWQKRIDELTREKYELRDQLTKAPTPKAESERTPAADEKFYTAADLELAATAKAQRIAADTLFNQKCDEVYNTAIKAFPDFDQALKTLGAGGVGIISPTDTSFLQAAFETEAPEKVLYHLGNDPEEAMRLQSLTPIRRAIELDRLATRLNAKGAEVVRKAPAPIKQVSGSASPNEDPEKMSTAEWMKWRDKQTS